MDSPLVAANFKDVAPQFPLVEVGEILYLPCKLAIQLRWFGACEEHCFMNGVRDRVVHAEHADHIVKKIMAILFVLTFILTRPVQPSAPKKNLNLCM